MKIIPCFMILISLVTVTFSHADTIIIVSDDWCPFNCEPGSEHPGYMVEIARLIFNKSGHTIEYINAPWNRAVDETRKGKYNAVIGAFKGDAPDFVFPENEQGIVGNSFFTKKESVWKYEGVPSLSTVNLGVIDSYDYNTEINDYIKQTPNSPKVQVMFGKNALELNINKLIKGRIDVVLESDAVFRYKISQMGHQNKIRSAGTLGPPEKAYIAFSPTTNKSKLYAKILSDGMSELRSSGKLKTVLADYGLTDWK